jgi:hypothetical protein
LSLRRCHSTPTSSLSREEWNLPLSPTTNQLRREKNLEPLQRESCRRRNRHRNIRRHHEAGERDPSQPVSRDEISEVGETLDERVFRERRNSQWHNHRQAQEQAEQEVKQHRENPLLGRNLNPDFARAMNTASEVGGVLARIADGLPRTPDAEGY